MMSDIHLETMDMLESSMDWESIRSHLMYTYCLSFAQAQGWMESVAADIAYDKGDQYEVEDV